MKTLLACVLTILLSFQMIFPIFAADAVTTTDQPVAADSRIRENRHTDLSVSPTIASVQTGSKNQVKYPNGVEFESLKKIIDAKFIPSTSKNTYGYASNCILGGRLCPNYRYTSIDEKAIKLIMLKTFIGNESFYMNIFNQNSTNSLRSYSSSDNQANGLQDILKRVPIGTVFLDWKVPNFGNTLGWDLLEASFGLNFSENTSAGMLGAIEQKIKDLKQTNCQNANQGSDSYTFCPWGGEISNIYLPTPEELTKETIYLNRESLKIESVKNEFTYTIMWASNTSSSTMADNYPNKASVDTMIANFIAEKENELTLLSSGAVFDSSYKSYIYSLREARKNPSLKNVSLALKDLKMNMTLRSLNKTEIDLMNAIKTELDSYSETLTKLGASITYSLKYTKDSYTLQEAKDEMEKKPLEQYTGIMTSWSSFWLSSLPCSSSTNYSVRSECVSAIANARDVATALGAYFSDREAYPDTIDQINQNYMPKWRGDFEKNFSYKNTTSWSNYDYEIKYIGHIGEWATDSGSTDMKKDYHALMSWATVPTIPVIFSHVPADSMVLYVKNPQDLIDILNQKSNTSNRLSGIDVSESVKDFMKAFFELQNFDQIEKHLKHEMAVVVNNLDATAPDVVIILSEADKEALSPTAKARVVGSKDGYIYIASSKDSLDRVMHVTLEKSLTRSSDFQYVWWKKSAKVQDALLFVGDAFFEKMLSFESYIAHYRKYRDYKRLSALQEVVWSYNDAFGKVPSSLMDLESLGLPTLTGAALQNYSIQDGLVVERHIGSLKSLKTLPEAQYDLSTITRSELEDYKANVLKYRDVWRASLDPMGIVLNRYGDGMEIDFFMTPIPTLENGELSQMQKFFQWVTKDSLAFVTNPHIRMGLASFVSGFDPKKLQAKIATDAEMNQDSKRFNQEIMGGGDILDYLGGEFAFSLGGLDSDIFDGWNVDKVDAYLSVQVATEEKGKELIDVLRKKIVDQFGSSEEIKTVTTFLAKPLIEDYAGKKIYYSEKIPVPFVWGLSFAYTFVDDFFIIGLNRMTIKHVIDVAASGDQAKKKILDTNMLSSGTFLWVLFDGEGMSSALKSLYEKNLPSFPRYMKNLNIDDQNLTTLMSSYVINSERERRLGNTPTPFDHTLWALEVRWSNGELTLSLDEKKMSVLTGSALALYNTLKNNESFPKDLLTSSGTSPDMLFSSTSFADILALNLILQLDSAFHGSESLLRNVIFAMNMGNDEIGFDLKVFRDKNTPSHTISPWAIFSWGDSMTLMLSLIWGALLLWGCVVGWVVLRRRKHNNGSGSSPSIVESAPVWWILPIIPLPTTPEAIVTPILTSASTEGNFPLPNVETLPVVWDPELTNVIVPASWIQEGIGNNSVLWVITPVVSSIPLPQLPE